MCVLADICNHTWIPECGRERSDGSLRLFIDECDLLEYNCDYELYYDIENYSACFAGVQSCPTTIPCPSKPTCPNHAFHRMGQHYFYITDARKMMRPPLTTTTKINLPRHMLHGKRRYTPTPRCRRAKPRTKPKTTARRTIPKNVKLTKKLAATKSVMKFFKRDTIILKRETVMKNGKLYVKIVKGFASKAVEKKHTKFDSDFIEK